MNEASITALQRLGDGSKAWGKQVQEVLAPFIQWLERLGRSLRHQAKRRYQVKAGRVVKKRMKQEGITWLFLLWWRCAHD